MKLTPRIVFLVSAAQSVARASLIRVFSMVHTPSPLSSSTYIASSPFFNAHQSNASTLLHPPLRSTWSVLYFAYLFIYITPFLSSLFNPTLEFSAQTVRWYCTPWRRRWLRLPSALFFVFFFVFSFDLLAPPPLRFLRGSRPL